MQMNTIQQSLFQQKSYQVLDKKYSMQHQVDANTLKQSLNQTARALSPTQSNLNNNSSQQQVQSECQINRIQTPQKQFKPVLMNVQSPGLPPTVFKSNGNRSISNVSKRSNASAKEEQQQIIKINGQNNFMTLGLQTLSDQPASLCSYSSQDMSQYFLNQHFVVRPFSQNSVSNSILKDSMQVIDQKGNLSKITEEDTTPNTSRQVNGKIQQAVFQFFQKKNIDQGQEQQNPIQIGLVTATTNENLKTPSTLNSDRIKQNLPSSPDLLKKDKKIQHEKYNQNNDDQKKLALHSFDPQQYHKLLKITEEKAIQASVQVEVCAPEPEKAIPRMHQQEYSSQKNISNQLNSSFCSTSTRSIQRQLSKPINENEFIDDTKPILDTQALRLKFIKKLTPNNLKKNNADKSKKNTEKLQKKQNEKPKTKKQHPKQIPQQQKTQIKQNKIQENDQLEITPFTDLKPPIDQVYNWKLCISLSNGLQDSEEQQIFAGNTLNKDKFLQELQQYLQKYDSNISSFTSTNYNSQPNKKYIKMQSLEESLSSKYDLKLDR